ncbi:MAG: sigma-70 family RNA polymerase sigma factor [Bacteroidetes bacterium]|nr:sigma-70 family RNA polymerase sigma factor [Bacteroidota bacterium]
MKEIQLIQVLQSRECSDSARQTAFTALHQKFEPKVKSYVSFLLHRRISDVVVTDLAEVAFVKAFLKINTYSSQYPFWVWLKQIVLNSVRDFLRAKKTKSLSYAEYNEESRAIRNLKDNTSADSSVICQETTKQVREFFASLPSKYRKVMVLRFYQDKSYEEISSILNNMNIGTISTIILRCRANLKKHMNL